MTHSMARNTHLKSPISRARTVTPDEVKEWFGRSRKAQLHEERYGAIAADITALKWPGDPPPPTDAPWLVKGTPDSDKDRWWDFEAVAKAAKLVLASLPAMRRHWNGLRWAPETRGGYNAIEALEETLKVALPYIEWPFGEYERATGRKTPKEWHIPSIILAGMIIRTMVEAGNRSPAISRNSVVARVATKALIRMGFQKELAQETVSMHLTRWDKKYGLTPNGIRVLTTK